MMTITIITTIVVTLTIMVLDAITAGMRLAAIPTITVLAATTIFPDATHETDTILETCPATILRNRDAITITTFPDATAILEMRLEIETTTHPDTTMILEPPLTETTTHPDAITILEIPLIETTTHPDAITILATHLVEILAILMAIATTMLRDAMTLTRLDVVTILLPVPRAMTRLEIETTTRRDGVLKVIPMELAAMSLTSLAIVAQIEVTPPKSVRVAPTTAKITGTTKTIGCRTNGDEVGELSSNRIPTDRASTALSPQLSASGLSAAKTYGQQ
jgi:hypothetical protein